MAPPILRRTGWSRKAQYSLFFGFIALIAGLAVGLVLLIISLVAPRTFDQIEGAALDATRPVREATTKVVTTVNGVMSETGGYWDAIEENKKLKAEREELRRRVIKAAATEQENKLLKDTLELQESLPETIATGRVIGSTKDSQRQFAILSVGTSNGVQSGMPVQAADGLIGRVVETGVTSSRVLLVTDRSNIVPAKILRSGEPVIATGKGELGIDLRPLEVGRNPFEPGDVIVTSGIGGLYAPLIPVARVVRLDDDGAIAVPLATPALSSFATVQPPYEPDAFATPEDEDE